MPKGIKKVNIEQTSPEAGTVAPTAPSAPVQAQAFTPRVKTLERQGNISAPYSRRYPQVRGGTCEWCGVQDGTKPAEIQYTLCPHFRDLKLSRDNPLRCSYCDESQNPNDIVYRSILNVAEDPSDPYSIIAWCNSTKCSDKHLARFSKNH